MTKNLKIKILILIMIVVAIYFYNTYPREINRSYNGLEFKIADIKYSREVIIKIDGWYTNRLFTEDEFKGSITIGDKKYSKLKLKFFRKGEWVLGFDEETSDFRSLGIMFVEKDLDKIVICKDVDGWNSKDGFIIAAPVKSRREAVDLSNKLLGGFLSNKKIN